MPNNLGGIIREVRKSKGLTQEELAELTGIARITISLIETGKTKEPRVVTVMLLEEHLECDLNSLMKNDEKCEKQQAYQGQYIKKLRRSRRLSQAQLAKLSGIPRSDISKIERGKIEKMQFGTLNLLAKALECDLDILLRKYNVSLGGTIQEARIQKGLSQMELAELIGISKKQIQNIERGKAKNPRLKVLKRLAQCLELNLQGLISESCEEQRSKALKDNTLGKIIREARVKKVLSGDKLAELAGITKTQLFNIERGKTKRPQLETLSKLVEYLDLDFEKVISKYYKEQINENWKDNALGTTIRKTRIIKGLSQKKLAELTGITEEQICNIEAGRAKKPRLGTLERLAKCLDLKVTDLIIL